MEKRAGGNDVHDDVADATLVVPVRQALVPV